jgi:alpha-beta hydrolase superfamily lysophospholipase
VYCVGADGARFRRDVLFLAGPFRALIDRYRKNGVKEVSHILYSGARHEPVNEFCRDQMHADVVNWLDAHLV